MSNISAILYPPTLDINYLVQRPQQLMKSFAQAGIPVFFLNRPSPHNAQGAGVTEPYSNFYLFNNVDPGLQQKGIRPVVYYSAGAQVDAVQQYDPSLVVFDSVDEPSDEFEAWRPFYFKAVGSADVVIATSEKLYSMALGINPNTYLVPNGCDFDYFSQADQGAFPIPEDIAGIPGPIIGYVGVIASWLDFELIERVAAEFPECSVVMVGPLYNVADVPQRPNIHYLGFKPYDQLAAYEQAFDVGIVPFKLSNMVESVNPIKMWEYMAAGLPIVTTNLPEAARHPDIILCSRDNDEFIHNLRRAIYEDTLELREQRLALARENSWLVRAQQVIAIIENHLAAKGAPAEAPPLPPIDSIPLRPPQLFLEETVIAFSEPSPNRHLDVVRTAGDVSAAAGSKAAVGATAVAGSTDISSEGQPVLTRKLAFTVSQLTPRRRLGVGRGVAFRFVTGSAAPLFGRFECAVIAKGSLHTRVRVGRSAFRLKTGRLVRAGG